MPSRIKQIKLLPLLIAILAILLSNGAKPANAQSKLVFAHYLVANQSYGNGYNFDDVAGYMKEIQQAQADGIDGFALNVGGWSGQPAYIKWCTEIFQAAVNLHSGFKLFMNADMCCTNNAADVVDMMRRFVNNPIYSPYYFRYNNRPFLSTFVGMDEGGGGPGALNFWQNSVVAVLKNGTNAANGIPATPIDVYFVPLFTPRPSVNDELPTFSEVQSSATSSYNAWWNQVADGLFYWGIAGVPGSGGTQAAPNLDTLLCSQSYSQIAKAGGKTYLSPVEGAQFWGADGQPGRRYYEYSGGEGLRKQWQNIFTNTLPDWVEIVTWNDYVECGYISPIDDPNIHPGNNLYTTNANYYRQHVGAYNLYPYYIQWYKTGSAPAITKDSIYWWYRTSSMNLTAGADVAVTNRYGPLADNIYVTCNLTSAATLKVTSGGNVHTVNVPAGSSDVEIPFSNGTQTFELDRNSSVVIPSHVADPILSSITLYNFDYTSGYMDSSGGGGGNGFSQPWFNQPQSIPGMVYAWNYDTGGEGVAFHSALTHNVTQAYFARTMETLNTETNQDNPQGADISMLSAGNWINYSVNVTAAGTYTASFRVASASTGGTIHMEDEHGNNLTGEITVPVTGSGQNWTTVSAPITLTAGRHWLKFVVDAGSGSNAMSLYYFTILSSPQTVPAAPTGISGLGTDKQASVSWSPVAGATSYQIYRSTSPGAEGTGPLMVAIFGTVWDEEDLADGTTYYYKVAAVNSAGSSTQSGEVAVTPTLIPAVTGPPTAPTTSTASPGQNQVTLSWGGGTGATSYNVYRSTSQGGEGTVPLINVSGPPYLDSGLTNGTTYYYKVAAVNSFGTSGMSPEAFATPSLPPAPPTPLGVTASAGNSQVTVGWTASTGASSYNLYRSTTQGGEGSTPVVPNVPASPYINTGLTNGTPYYFKVAAVGPGGTSAQSGEVGPVTPNVPIPPAPTGLAGIAGNTTATLSWTGSSGAASYNIYQNGTFKSNVTSTSNQVVSSLTNGTAYNFTVAAVNSAGTSGMSNQVTVTPSSSSTVIAIACGNSAVAPFVADVDFSGGAVSSGTTNAINTSGVTSPAPTSVYQHGRKGTFTYTIPGLVAGTSYGVRLHFCEYAHTGTGQRQFNVSINGTQVLTNFDIFAAAGAEFKANIQSFTTTANASGQIVIVYTTVLDNALAAGIEITTSGGGGNTAPTTPVLTATAGDTTVSLSWTGGTGTPTPTFTLLRGTVSGTYTTTLLSNSNASTFNDTGLTNGTQYFYVVKASNSVGTATSIEKSAIPAAANTAPTTPVLTATAGNTSVNLSWTGGTGTPTPTFTLLRGTVSGTYTTTLLSNSNASSFTDTGLTNGTQYFYIVKAINSAGTATSIEKSAIPAPTNTAPTTPVLTANPANTSVALSWTGGTGTPTPSFTLLRGTVSGTYTTTLLSSSNATSFNDTGLTNGTPYFYVVKAINSVGTATSIEKSATPQGGVAGIDLIVTSISWTPTTLASGAHVVFSAVIKNQGSVATPAGTIVGCQFAIDGHTTPITWSDTNSTSLAPGASVTLTANNGTNAVNYWPATSGSHTVQAWVDDVNRIAESNETNNKTTAPITVP